MKNKKISSYIIIAILCIYPAPLIMTLHAIKKDKTKAKSVIKDNIKRVYIDNNIIDEMPVLFKTEGEVYIEKMESKLKNQDIKKLSIKQLIVLTDPELPEK